jgi:hypothetical protein
VDIVFFKSTQTIQATVRGKSAKRKTLSGQLPELSLKILELAKSRGRITISDTDNFFHDQIILRQNYGKKQTFGVI